MHMVDERVAVSDLETLTQIYETFIERWFRKCRGLGRFNTICRVCGC